MPNTPEKRDIDPTRKILTLDQKAALIVANRFKGKRPDNLADEVFTEGDGVKSRVAKLFDDLEGKIDVAKLETLRADFEASIAPWIEAGLFSEERAARGYRKPEFTRDYQPLIGVDDIDRMEAGKGLDKGYSRAVWAPADVAIASENPETLTYLKVAKETLLKAFHTKIGDKKPDTLLVGPQKRVLNAAQVKLDEILWQWECYKKPGIVYNPEELSPKTHAGQAEVAMLAALKGTEKQTGGVFRLERDSLIMPKDVERKSMSARDWHALLKNDKRLPPEVRAQDAKQALAYIIHCLNTQGWIPDYYEYNDLANSRIALAPETYIPDESSAGAVPAFCWGIYDRRFSADGDFADNQYADLGVRGGVRKNNEKA